MFRTKVENEYQKSLLDYWHIKARGKCFPRRSDIHPEEIKDLLPHIGLIDVTGPRQFRYRLIGTAMVDFFRTDFTGTYVNQSKPGKYGEFLIDLYACAVEVKRPVFSKSAFLYDDDRGLFTQRLILPLGSNQQSVDTLLFSTIPILDKHTKLENIRVIEDSIDFEEHCRFTEINEHAHQIA
ncbi:PAS domain-containing protein [Sneathiella sp.]|jgi:hypothetical protein|uniref:PAS domain-containing protein n=1 Tax=Sneathiella sp. TaxID=1964365 RepID=UPI0039E42CC6